MAELISWNCSNITQTQATLTFEYSKTWETPRAGHIREYHPVVELLSPIGTLGTIEFIEQSTTGGIIIVPITNLTSSNVNSIQCKLTFAQKEYVDETKYFFYRKRAEGNYYEVSSNDLDQVKDRYVQLAQTDGVILNPPTDRYDDYKTEAWEDKQLGKICEVYTITNEGWQVQGDVIITTEKKNVYTRPKNFYFNGSSQCTSGQQWDVSQGITSLLTNFHNFNDCATAWKQWKNQSNIVMNCSAFGTRGPLTASMMNAAYDYLDIELEKRFEQGDIITAKMFSDLEEKLNK